MIVLSVPAIYALELTAACNNRCPGCSNVYSTDRTPPPLSASAWELVLAKVGPEAVQVRLTGGEPTLHTEFLRILDAATAYDAEVTLFTNGRWAKPEEFIRRLQGRPRLTGLLVSLHGATAASHEAYTCARGSFEQAVANIRRAAESGLPVSLSTIITRHSWDQVSDVLELSRRIGAQQVAFNRYLGPPSPDIEPSARQLRDAVARIEALVRAGEPVKYGVVIPQCFIANSSAGCLAGAAYAAVDPWGNLRPCSHSPTVAGSLRDTPLPDLWHGERMRAWRALVPAGCTSCAAYSDCHGGCRAVQEMRPDRSDPLRSQPLDQPASAQPHKPHALPAHARPRMTGRLRVESFGYAVLGNGHAVPVRAEAGAAIAACDGATTFAQLAERYGQSGLNVLGDLWQMGLLEITNATPEGCA